MTFNELLAIIGGLGIGYVVVARFIGGSHEAAPAAQEPPPRVAEQSEAPPYVDPQHISNNWFLILDVPVRPTREEVVAAYQRKRRDHDARLQAGITPAQRESAEREWLQVNAAYEYAIKYVR